MNAVEGKTAIVTGAANGLGYATAKLLVQGGASVVLADIDAERGTMLADELGDRARFHMLDVWDEDQWVEAIAFARATFGSYNVLVNNAAVNPLLSIEEATKEQWLHIFQTNAGGYFLGCKHAILSMKHSGGSIINVSSNSSRIGMATVPIYSSTKGAINVLTKSLTAHCRKNRLPIRVNTVMPGGMVSKLSRDTFLAMTGVDIEDGSPEAAGLVAAANLVAPQDVAEVIVFMASDASRNMQGAEILVDGGDSVVFDRT